MWAQWRRRYEVRFDLSFAEDWTLMGVGGQRMLLNSKIAWKVACIITAQSTGSVSRRQRSTLRDFGGGPLRSWPSDRHMGYSASVEFQIIEHLDRAVLNCRRTSSREAGRRWHHASDQALRAGLGVP